MQNGWVNFLISIVLLTTFVGCGQKLRKEQTVVEKQPIIEVRPIERIREIVNVKETNAYEKVGQFWGERLNKNSVDTQTDVIDEHFVYFLLTSDIVEANEKIDLGSDDFYLKTKETYYFRIHMSLKRAFQDGFRVGFKHRNADLVLGPNIERGASILGKASAIQFGLTIRDYNDKNMKLMKTIRDNIRSSRLTESMNNELKRTINLSIDIFKELIAEGSPADRDRFERQFRDNYRRYVENYLEHLPQHTRGKGTRYISTNFDIQKEHKDVTFVNRLPNAKGAIYQLSHHLSFKTSFGMKKAQEVWNHIYTKSLEGVGAELGSKFSHNLISRSELLDWLRRAVLSSKSKKDELLIERGFIQAYGAGQVGKKVFLSLRKDLGL